MSVLRVYQNPVAINANRNLKITGMSISKSLERLSSGLRINRAADDAAGLSISEKLRAQVRGLNRASSNAMDGISLIQTAEGALGEVHSILQRMRELAVQAANGIYTSQDRQAIQSEVKELTDEINRIARTTEFNTKTLLDGTLGALISTDDYSRIRAAVAGNVGNGGNFVLKAVAKSSGVLQVQKSDVFSTTQAADAVGQLNYLNTWRANATLASAGTNGVGATGIYQVEVPIDANGSTAVNSSSDGRISIYNAAEVTPATDILSQSLQAEELSTGDKIVLTLSTATGIQQFSVVFTTPATLTVTSLATQISAALGTLAAGGAAYNAGTGFDLNLVATARILNTKFVDTDGSGSDLYVSFAANGATSNQLYAAFSYAFVNNGNTFNPGAATTGTGGVVSIGDATTGTLNVRFDVRYSGWASIAAGAIDRTDTVRWGRYSGGNSVQKYGRISQVGPVPINATYLVSAITNRTYAVFAFDNAAYTSLVAGGTDQTIAQAASRGARQLGLQGGVSVSIFAIDEVFRGTAGSELENVRIAVDGILQAGENSTFNMSTNVVLTADQLNTLASLNRFQEFGVFKGRKNVEFTIYLRGSSRSATINLSQNDTLEDLAGKISLAIWNPADGSGIINTGILNPQYAPDLVHINTIGVAKGTMSITTPVPGAELVFAGDDALLKALSLVEVRQAKSAVYSINAFNLEKGALVGATKVDSNEINGLLPGLRIFFDNTLGLRLDPQPPVSLSGGANTLTSFGYQLPTERPVISLSGRVESFFIHVAPRSFDLQIGANQGQTISSFIADMSAQALGVEGLIVAESPLAQEAITIIDVAIDRVSTQRSRLGAIQNRLESTIRNLDVAAENLTSSESRIRDTDVALETLTLTRNQILLQAGTAALAQANQLPQTVLQLLR